ncbi:hypothetical protein [Fusibacter ferrireducens]|uniref:Lipoprotein n=1 Tax=Fusibacter ferrireducens TaxID=2785058 RepID=A0ABS0A005_9FIRM|nr:hypothetical protein [Fusibacter ferrireducens]MBF4696032.1 hypothetical protein [Fusibacter ferrireducens]
MINHYLGRKRVIILIAILFLLTSCEKSNMVNNANTVPIQDVVETNATSQESLQWGHNYSLWLNAIDALLTDHRPYFLPEIKEGNYEFVYEIKEDAVSYAIFKYDYFTVLDQKDHDGHVHTLYDHIFSFERAHDHNDFFQSICDDYSIDKNNVTVDHGIYTYDERLTQYTLENGYTLYLINSDSDHTLSYDKVLEYISPLDFTNFTNVSIAVAELTHSSIIKIYFEDTDYYYEMSFHDALGSGLIEYK